MKVFVEMEMYEFTPWAGAVNTYNMLTDGEKYELQRWIEEAYPKGLTETDINDILWFDDELICTITGFNDFDEFFENRKDRL